MSQSDAVVGGDPGSPSIRATMDDGIEHALDIAVTEPKRGMLKAERTGYAAHALVTGRELPPKPPRYRISKDFGSNFFVSSSCRCVPAEKPHAPRKPPKCDKTAPTIEGGSALRKLG